MAKGLKMKLKILLTVSLQVERAYIRVSKYSYPKSMSIESNNLAELAWILRYLTGGLESMILELGFQIEYILNS